MLAMLGLGLAMMPPDQQRALMDYEEKPKTKKALIERPPSGTKEYFFNSIGEFSTTKMLKSECVFICYAINDKNAKRKFAKWQKQT
jgi:hypothetical protein